MQRILLSLCTGTLLLFAQTKAQAQEEPPRIKRHLIGGSFSFASSNTESLGFKTTTIGFSLLPTYAYYFKDHVAIGASLSYAYVKYTNSTGVKESKSNGYYFAPFIRFDIPLWQSRFSIYNDFGISGNYSRMVDTDSVSVRRSSWGAGAFYEPGLMFRIKSNILLQASLGQLLAYNYQNTATAESHSFGIRGNHSGTDDFKIGINFLF